MREQIFISYRRVGGDVYAKLICESLKSRGYTVFFDFDSIRGGYFDERIYRAIETCNDFILVLSPSALDRCQNEGDWVRKEIKHALDHDKNIIPLMMPGFVFPKTLPKDIEKVSRINGVEFVMSYYDAVIDAITNRLSLQASTGLKFSLNDDQTGYTVIGIGTCTDTDVVIPKFHNNKPVTAIGDNAFLGCSSFTNVIIPEGVTRIGDYAFSNCQSLTNVTIPESVTYLGKYALDASDSLSTVRYNGTIEQMKKIAVSYRHSFRGSVECSDGTFTDFMNWRLQETMQLFEQFQHFGKLF